MGGNGRYRLLPPSAARYRPFNRCFEILVRADTRIHNAALGIEHRHVRRRRRLERPDGLHEDSAVYTPENLGDLLPA